MKYIQLSKNKQTLVDDEDFDFLNQWRWKYHKNNYAVRTTTHGNVYMHRVINNTPDGVETDHLDRNGLNNQKSNLKTVSHQQNMVNRGIQKNNVSGYKGIYWFKLRNKWRVEISVNGKNIHLGLFNDIKEAFVARQLAEIRYYSSL